MIYISSMDDLRWVIRSIHWWSWRLSSCIGRGFRWERMRIMTTMIISQDSDKLNWSKTDFAKDYSFRSVSRDYEIYLDIDLMRNYWKIFSRRGGMMGFRLNLLKDSSKSRISIVSIRLGVDIIIIEFIGRFSWNISSYIKIVRLLYESRLL